MKELMRPILELAVLLPGLLLGYIPMKNHLRIHPGKLAAFLAPLAVGLCVAGGSLCYALHIGTGWVMAALILLFSFIYLRTLDMIQLRAFNVVLAICAVFSCLNNVARAINAMLDTTKEELWFSMSGCLIYFLLCTLFVAIASFPAHHKVVELMDEEATARTWYFFWILPLAFFCLNLFMLPLASAFLYRGHIVHEYLIINLFLLSVLCLSYAVFYLVARGLNRNEQLQQENQFLSMQQAQYNSLLLAVEETRQARHDLRHHFQILSGLAKQEEWAEITRYLSSVWTDIPDRELMLCANPAIDGVAGYYAALYRKHNIPCAIKIDLPPELPVADIDVCLILSNLLENALEASLHTEPAGRRIQVKASLHTSHILLLTVENTFDGMIKEENGVFQSSKRKGSGVGIQSVRRIAERNGGHCRFTHEGGRFTANVMLRGS